MAKILVEMEDYEFAKLCAERICKIWNKVEKENENMLADIIEYDITGLNEISNIIDFADNFIINYAECQFGAKEIIDFIIKELEINLKDIIEFLNLDIKDTNSYFKEFERYLEENENFVELNYFIQERTHHKGKFNIVYGDSHKICSYLRY